MSTSTAVVETYFERLDARADMLDLFADDAEVFFPKWGIGRGREEVSTMFRSFGALIRSIEHPAAHMRWTSDGDRVVVEGRTSGTMADGSSWTVEDRFRGRYCNVFDVRAGKIVRLSVYLDPDYWAQDVVRFPWLADASSS